MGVDVASFLGGIFGGAVGGAVVQSALDPLFGQRQMRRELRANVVHCLDEVEDVRPNGLESDAFRDRVASLRLAVLKAGLKPAPAELYIDGASLYRKGKGRAIDIAGTGPKANADTLKEVDELVVSAAGVLRRYALQPHRKRLGLARSVHPLEQEKAAIRKKVDDEMEAARAR